MYKALLGAKLRPEEELLLCLARTFLDTETTVRVEMLLRAGIDYDYLLQAASPHGMMPLVFRHLNAARYKEVPEPVISCLRDYYNSNAQYNLLLTGELLRVLDMFNANNLPVIPFKGPVLAASVYGNPALRRFCDLDILIRREDIKKANDLLESQGYLPEIQVGGAQERALIAHQNQRAYKNNRNTTIEIHWEIMSPSFSLSLCYENLQKPFSQVGLAGREVTTLSAEDTLLTLCLHGSKHLWERLAWLADVAEFIRNHKDLDWEVIINRANDLGCRRMLLLGLFLAYCLLGIDLPIKILKNIQAERAIKSLGETICSNLFANTKGRPQEGRELFLCSYHLKLMDRIPSRINHCFQGVTASTQTDWDSLPLPPTLFFLYRFFRPTRLCFKHGRRLTRHPLKRT